MTAKQLLVICSASGSALCSCNTANDGAAHFTDADCDKTVAIGDDFYQHTNGGWMAQHPLPDDKSRLGTFDLLDEDNNEKLRIVVEEACKNPGAQGSASQKIGDLYACGMDTAARNAEGFAALVPYIDKIAATEGDEDFARLVAELQQIGVYPFFAFGSSPDMANSSWTIAEVWQSGIGLPDRDYYFDESDKGREVIEAYKTSLTRYFDAIGRDNATDRTAAVYDFEKRLAEQMNTRLENRDPQALYNTTDLEGFKKQVPGFAWDAYFDACGAKIEQINISQLKYFGAMGKIIAETPIDVVKDYLTAVLVRGYASKMSDEFIEISFDFFGRTLNGNPEMRPLWKRVLGQVEGALGEQIGQVFVEKYFPASAKKRMEDLIEQLRIAFGQRINELTWMGDSTKAAAQEKLAAISVKVGYPDKWRDYSGLEINKEDGFVKNFMAASRFEFQRDIEKINKPVDKSEWHMTPQTVNAYYNPTVNEIVFPAGILQPPFFYAEGDDAVNYGAIGVVIGHEMTHGFDDQGRQFDKDGNLKNWWTETDAEQFKAITARLAEHFSGYEVVDSLHINGELTLGENIADLGGLNISYQALRNALGDTEPEAIDGQTVDQRFLFAYSRIWAGNTRDEYLRKQVLTDPHSPGRYRVNAQLPLFHVFYTAFGIKESDGMYMPEDKRITIW